jgi:hypothetical protein
MNRIGRTLLMVVALVGAGCGSSLNDTKPSGDGGPEAASDGGPEAASDGGQCHDFFSVEPDGSSPTVPCCPAPAPDCATLADGYPGYLCVDRTNQFCSCSCSQHMWQCAC